MTEDEAVLQVNEFIVSQDYPIKASAEDSAPMNNEDAVVEK
jgi:hypothetical protein